MSDVMTLTLREEIRRRRAAAAVAAAKVAEGQPHVIVQRGRKRLVHAGKRIRLEVCEREGGAWICIDDIYTGDREAVQRLASDLIVLDEDAYDYFVGAGLLVDLDLAEVEA
jgi:hypothetical protein